MIKVSVFYPNVDGKKFDADYYLNKHLPMVQEKFGNVLKGTAVEVGLAGGDPGSPPPYRTMGHLYFDSVEAFQAAFAPHMQSIMEDIPKFTDVQPTIQISEVKV
jgi:uncharacterized protein (TIGR02118 family)